MKHPIRIGLADDHTLFRSGIKGMIQNDPGIEIRIEAENGNDLLDQMKRTKVDVVLTDISMPEMDGEEVTRILSRDHKDIPVIALSMHNDLVTIKRMMAAGVKGYVLKSAHPPELLTSIKHVSMGKVFFCSGTMSLLMKEVVVPEGEVKSNSITDRELIMLRMFYDECSEQEIADTFQVNIKTVGTWKKELFRKAGTTTIVGLVKWYAKNYL